MIDIDYDHSRNVHTSMAPAAIVKILLERYPVSSVLDVGCGTGAWLNEFTRCNVSDVYGVDGISIENREFAIDPNLFKLVDLRYGWNLGRKFDLAVCFEVAEHLPPESAPELIKSVSRHTDLIIFSAACPFQGGQGHINCQWPSYWQAIFNDYGFSCVDSLRSIIWQDDFPEYWYKQNIFIAYRDSILAGKEDRILPLVHPNLLQSWVNEANAMHALMDGRQGLLVSLAHALRLSSKAVIYALRNMFVWPSLLSGILNAKNYRSHCSDGQLGNK